jgi:hypothetical protein
MQLTVGAGAFRAAGVDHSFPEDIDCDLVSDLTFATDTIGYIVKNKDTGVASVLVDEVVRDGIDTPYVFDSGQAYVPLHVLFICKVAIGAVSLDDAPLWVYQIVEELE